MHNTKHLGCRFVFADIVCVLYITSTNRCHSCCSHAMLLHVQHHIVGVLCDLLCSRQQLPLRTYMIETNSMKQK